MIITVFKKYLYIMLNCQLKVQINLLNEIGECREGCGVWNIIEADVNCLY